MALPYRWSNPRGKGSRRMGSASLEPVQKNDPNAMTIAEKLEKTLRDRIRENGALDETQANSFITVIGRSDQLRVMNIPVLAKVFEFLVRFPQYQRYLVPLNKRKTESTNLSASLLPPLESESSDETLYMDAPTAEMVRPEIDDIMEKQYTKIKNADVTPDGLAVVRIRLHATFIRYIVQYSMTRMKYFVD